MDRTNLFTSMPCGRMTMLPALNLAAGPAALSSLSLVLEEVLAFRFWEVVRSFPLARLRGLDEEDVVDGSLGFCIEGRVSGIGICYTQKDNTFVLCGRNPCLVSEMASVIAAAEASF